MRYNMLISILYNRVFKIVRVAQMDPKWCRSPKKVTLNTLNCFSWARSRSHFLFIADSWRQIELLHDLFYHFCLRCRFFFLQRNFSLIHFQDNELSKSSAKNEAVCYSKWIGQIKILLQKNVFRNQLYNISSYMIHKPKYFKYRLLN